MLNYIRRKYAILLLVLFLLGCLLYWILLRQVMDITIKEIYVRDLDTKSIEVLKSSYKYDFGLSDNQLKNILDNPKQYKYIVYLFDIKNISKSRVIGYVKLIPSFSEELKPYVIGYVKGFDGESPIFINPLSSYKGVPKLVLVKATEMTDTELVNLAKKSNFNVTGFTTGESIFDFGYSFKSVKY